MVEEAGHPEALQGLNVLLKEAVYVGYALLQVREVEGEAAGGWVGVVQPLGRRPVIHYVVEELDGYVLWHDFI